MLCTKQLKPLQDGLAESTPYSFMCSCSDMSSSCLLRASTEPVSVLCAEDKSEEYGGLSDSLVAKVIAFQSQISEIDPLHTHEEHQAWWPVTLLVMVLGRQRQDDAWCSMDSLIGVL